MSAHTPGPWEVDTKGRGSERDPQYFAVEATRDGESITIADTLNCHFGFEPDDQKANVNLIAAAPELLEALRRIILLDPMLPIGEPPDPLYFIRQAQIIAHAAIAKAEGRKP